jgi:hypothetical protein
MTAIATSYESLLKVRKGAVDIVDVPEFGFAAVTGTGEPGGAEFTEAVQALYSVSYGAHFRLKKLTGEAPRVMPLEGLWWVDDPAQQDIVAAVARGEVTMAGSDRGSWRWQALIMQPDPIDAELIAAATAEAAGKKDLPGLARLEYTRWAEGRCAQLLHIGPYAAEAPSIAALHEAIAGSGYRPRGRHHEIYLGDPRRSAPEKLRTIIRHPVEPVHGVLPARGGPRVPNGADPYPAPVRSDMTQGTVKWFNAEKGGGFKQSGHGSMQARPAGTGKR